MNVLVIGTGAIGSLYGSLLAMAGAKVSVVARSDYDHVKQHGIDIQSYKFGLYHFKPAHVLRHAGEMDEKPDYVLLCIKFLEGDDHIGLLKGALGPHTSIVVIANGIAIEKEFAEAFPRHELISGLAFVGVSRTAPGRIWHQDFGRLTLGNYPEGVSEKTKALCVAVQKSGIECVANENIITARWEKCVWNAAFNPLSVLSGGLGVDDILGTQEALVRAIMEEVCRIAAAVGHALADDTVDARVQSTRKMAAYKTSMLLDFEAGRPMETEAILGATVRAARKANVLAPNLESIYALMKLRELKISKEKKAS